MRWALRSPAGFWHRLVVLLSSRVVIGAVGKGRSSSVPLNRLLRRLAALTFSGGVFVCVALADLLPEVRFHSHDRFKLTAALLLGFASAYGLGLLESEAAHPTTPPAGGDEHHGHSHAAAHQLDQPITRADSASKLRSDPNAAVARRRYWLTPN